jgi:hypothetical protein
LYYHFKKAYFILLALIFLNRFYELTRDVAKNLSFAFFSTTNWEIWPSNWSFSSVTFFMLI